MTIVYLTATTVNGYLADDQDSLEWLFRVKGEHPDTTGFIEQVSVLVMGSTTYEWVLQHTGLVERPEQWREFFGERPMFVFTSRDLPVPQGATVAFLSGPVTEHLAMLLATAGSGVIWVQGGGDLAGQFLDIDALDEIVVTIAPAFLASGRPLLPRDVFSDRMSLVSVEQVGDFVSVRYRIMPKNTVRTRVPGQD